MAFFSGSTYVSPKKGKKESVVTPYQLLLSREASLRMYYGDGMTNDILNNNFFIELQSEYEKALNDPNIKENEKLEILEKMQGLNREQQKWSINHQPLMQKTTKTMEAEIGETWMNTWKDKEFLDKGDVTGMSIQMLEYLDQENTTLQSYADQLRETTTDATILDTMDEKLDYLRGQMAFYRGVVANPSAYAVLVDSRPTGEITDFKLKSIYDIAGYENTGQILATPEELKVSKVGVALYGRPYPNSIDQTGLAKIIIGNNEFQGEIGKVFALAGKGENIQFDPTSLRNAPFENYAAGDILKNSDGNFWINKPDGGWIYYPSLQTAQGAGFDTTRAQSITRNESETLRKGYDIEYQAQTKMPGAEVRDALGGVVMGLQTKPIQSKPSELPSSLPQFQSKLGNPIDDSKALTKTFRQDYEIRKQNRRKVSLSPIDIKLARGDYQIDMSGSNALASKVGKEKQTEKTKQIYQSRM